LNFKKYFQFSEYKFSAALSAGVFVTEYTSALKTQSLSADKKKNILSADILQTNR